VGRTRTLWIRAGELALVALVGGAVALGGAALLGKLGSHTTIQQVSPLGGGGVGNVTLQAPTTTGALTAEQIYKRDAPGVVQVTATTSGGESLGSGFVIDKAGHIVTNFHVVRGATKVHVSFSGKDQLVSTVVGLDPSTDLAILKIQTRANALTPLELGNSDAVRVGDTVYAIGNPFGLYARTLTSGIVSAVQRRITAPNTLPIDNAIQTDASINHGNSGGPLIDAAGRVIGVTSQIYAENSQQGNIGIGFAVPVNTVRNIAAQIISTGKVEHAYLGVSTTPVTAQLSKLYSLPSAGLLVARADPGGPAASAGVVGGSTDVVVGGESYTLGGDVIVSIDGAPVSAFEQLRDAIARKKPGDKVKLEVVRNGSKKSLTVKLGQAPSG
jgi:S1-C subfamily serine protease